MLTFILILEHSWSIGSLVYLVQNIRAHKGEGYFLPECFEGFSRTNSTGRTIPREVREKSTYLCAK